MHKDSNENPLPTYESSSNSNKHIKPTSKKSPFILSQISNQTKESVNKNPVDIMDITLIEKSDDEMLEPDFELDFDDDEIYSNPQNKDSVNINTVDLLDTSLKEKSNDEILEPEFEIDIDNLEILSNLQNIVFPSNISNSNNGKEIFNENINNQTFVAESNLQLTVVNTLEDAAKNTIDESKDKIVFPTSTIQALIPEFQLHQIIPNIVNSRPSFKDKKKEKSMSFIHPSENEIVFETSTIENLIPAFNVFDYPEENQYTLSNNDNRFENFPVVKEIVHDQVDNKNHIDALENKEFEDVPKSELDNVSYIFVDNSSRDDEEYKIIAHDKAKETTTNINDIHDNYKKVDNSTEEHQRPNDKFFQFPERQTSFKENKQLFISLLSKNPDQFQNDFRQIKKVRISKEELVKRLLKSNQEISISKQKETTIDSLETKVEDQEDFIITTKDPFTLINAQTSTISNNLSIKAQEYLDNGKEEIIVNNETEISRGEQLIPDFQINIDAVKNPFSKQQLISPIASNISALGSESLLEEEFALSSEVDTDFIKDNFVNLNAKEKDTTKAENSMENNPSSNHDSLFSLLNNNNSVFNVQEVFKSSTNDILKTSKHISEEFFKDKDYLYFDSSFENDLVGLVNNNNSLEEDFEIRIYSNDTSKHLEDQSRDVDYLYFDNSFENDIMSLVNNDSSIHFDISKITLLDDLAKHREQKSSNADLLYINNSFDDNLVDYTYYDNSFENELMDLIMTKEINFSKEKKNINSTKDNSKDLSSDKDRTGKAFSNQEDVSIQILGSSS